MLNEDNIAVMFRNFRTYEYEFSIIQDCANNAHDTCYRLCGRYDLLKRRIALIGHMLELLPRDEVSIVMLHLVENKPWNTIIELLNSGEVPITIGTDRRSLQRTQRRAIRRVFAFLAKKFGGTLDYLIDNGKG